MMKSRRIRFKFLGGLVIAILTCFYTKTGAKENNLTIYYFHRPPYYFKTNGASPKGFIMTFVVKVFERAGLEVDFQEFPPKRILEELKKPKRACSPGWFKTPDREKLYLFSAPIYRDAPLTFVMSRQNAEDSKITVKEMIAFIRSSRVPGLICGFSYGPFLDSIFSKEELFTRCISTSVVNVLKMIATKRVDFTIIFSEEFGYIFNNYPELRKSLATMVIDGVHEGNKRYLMCSKGLSERTIERINESIRSIVSWLD
ncbi:MAG: transporter substrate-binding domain-containing protein [Syntrophobacterales bacterium]|nr:transporter substrate-binding domain-containing protein [Syntrophobacterales bacterium]